MWRQRPSSRGETCLFCSWLTYLIRNHILCLVSPSRNAEHRFIVYFGTLQPHMLVPVRSIVILLPYHKDSQPEVLVPLLQVPGSCHGKIFE